MARILVTPRSLTANPPPALDALKIAGFDLVFSRAGQTPTEDDLLGLVPGCVGWLAGVEPVSERVIAAANQLRIISRNGTGVDSLPLDLLERRQIEVMRAPAANATGVAELALGLMISVCRALPITARQVAEGLWPRISGREIGGTTVGIVGLGAIGRKLARILIAMNAHVLAHDPFAGDIAEFAGKVRLCSFEELLGAATIVSLHCPMPADGKPLIDRDAIELIGENGIVINTARAGLVDETALLDALDSGKLAGYGTDVFDPEPPTDLKLAGHSRVVATSHIGGLTAQSVERATQAAVDNLLRGLST